MCPSSQHIPVCISHLLHCLMEEVNSTAAAPAQNALLQPSTSAAKIFRHEGLEMSYFWEAQFICLWETSFFCKISGWGTKNGPSSCACKSQLNPGHCYPAFSEMLSADWVVHLQGLQNSLAHITEEVANAFGTMFFQCKTPSSLVQNIYPHVLFPDKRSAADLLDMHS